MVRLQSNVCADLPKALSVMVVLERSSRFRFGQRQSISQTCRMGGGGGGGGGWGGDGDGMGRKRGWGGNREGEGIR